MRKTKRGKIVAHVTENKEGEKRVKDVSLTSLELKELQLVQSVNCFFSFLSDFVSPLAFLTGQNKQLQL